MSRWTDKRPKTESKTKSGKENSRGGLFLSSHVVCRTHFAACDTFSGTRRHKILEKNV